MQQNFISAALTGLACALALSACASVSPAGLIAASRLDPLNTPPSEIAVAIGVPGSLRLADGDAELRIAFTGGSAASTVLIDETASLQLRLVSAGEPQPNSDEEVVYAAHLAAEDATRIAAAQAEIRALRARGIEGKGALGVTVVGGCLLESPLRVLPVSTWLQTDREDGFVSLTREQDIFRVLDESDAAALRAHLIPCDESRS
ncbi:MAG: hypothetical protein ACTS10_02235 [Kiloniellales bacterium]